LGAQLASFAATGSPVAAQGAATWGQLQQLSFSFAADASGAPALGALALLGDPTAFAAQLGQLSDGRGAWPGVPLSASSSATLLQIALPMGPAAANFSVAVYALVQDAFGQTQAVSVNVTVQPWPQADDPAAVSDLITSQLASLANVTDGLSAISAVGGLGALLQGASSASPNASSAAQDAIVTSLLFRPSAASALSGDPISTAPYLQPDFKGAAAAAVASVLGISASSGVTVGGAELVYAGDLSGARRRLQAASEAGTGPVVGVRLLIDILSAAAATSPLANAGGGAISNAALAASVGAAVGSAMTSGAVAAALASQSGALAALGFSSAPSSSRRSRSTRRARRSRAARMTTCAPPIRCCARRSSAL